MDEKQKKHTGKFMSLILRHQPEIAGITLDHAGWVSVEELLAGMKRQGHVLTLEQLKDIVSNNDKQRYSFNHDKNKIRANQGHSLTLDLQLNAIQPPNQLYHGTASHFIESIKKEGLQKRKRHHVHLSKNKKTAHSVGSRHGKPVILTIASNTMYQEGYEFYCSENEVWLVDNVPPKYFIEYLK